VYIQFSRGIILKHYSIIISIKQFIRRGAFYIIFNLYIAKVNIRFPRGNREREKFFVCSKGGCRTVVPLERVHTVINVEKMRCGLQRKKYE